MNNSETAQTEVHLRIGKAWIENDGIVRIEFGPSSEHHIEDGHEVVEAHDRLADAAGVDKVPVLADIRKAKVGADAQTRAYYSTQGAAARKSAMAMLTSSAAQRMLGNFFFRVNSPPYPAKMFSDQDKALRWLGQFL